MVAHIFPLTAANIGCAYATMYRQAGTRALLRMDTGYGAHGPVCLQLQLAPGCQGAGVDPRFLPFGAGPRWLRGTLLLSHPRPPRSGCWRQCAARRNRDLDRAILTLFRRAGAIFDRAFWYQRGAQDRWRRTSSPNRTAQESRRHQGRSHLCRTGTQISDLGAGSFPRGTRGGHREGSRCQTAARFPGGGARPARSTGMMASSGSNHAVAGGLARHTPVLGRTAVDFLAVREGGAYVDATFGAGGYSREILRRANCIVLAIDRDPESIASGSDLVQSSRRRFSSD